MKAFFVFVGVIVFSSLFPKAPGSSIMTTTMINPNPEIGIDTVAMPAQAGIQEVAVATMPVLAGFPGQARE